MISKTLAELRGFTSDNYLKSQSSGTAAGATDGFVVQIGTRQLGPKSDQTFDLIAGNIEPGVSGWALLRLPDTEDGGVMNFGFFLHAGVDEFILPVAFSAIVGKCDDFVLTYEPPPAEGVGTIRIFVNGVLVASQGTNSDNFIPSNSYLTVGFDAPLAPAAMSSFVGLTYFEGTTTPEEVAHAHLEFIKRYEPSDAGWDTLRNLVYSVQHDAGVGNPTVLTNRGTTLGQPLLRVGTLIFGTPPYDWGFIPGSGAQGPQGPQGPQGVVGPQGAQGPQGPQGIAPMLAPLDLYVAPATAPFPGNDANDGITPATPVETLAAAWSKLPSHWLGAPVRVHFATNPALRWSPIPNLEAFNADGQLDLLGDGAGQPGDTGMNNLLGPVACGGATTGVLIDGAFGVIDQYQGYTIEFVDGTAVGQRRTIRNNTVTELIPVAEFSPAPTPGDNFVIFESTIVVDASSDINVALEDTPIVNIVNMAFDGAGTVYADNIEQIKLWGCTFINGTHLSMNSGNLYAGISPANNPIVNITPLYFTEFEVATGYSLKDWTGWGVGAPLTNLLLDGADTLTGYFVSGAWCLLQASGPVDSVNLNVLGGFFNSITIQYGGKLSFVASAGIPTLCRFNSVENPVGGAVEVSSGHWTVVGGSQAIEFDGTNGNSLIHLLNATEGVWYGDMEIAEMQGPYYALLNKGSTFNVYGNVNAPELRGVALFAALDGSTCNVDGSITMAQLVIAPCTASLTAQNSMFTCTGLITMQGLSKFSTAIVSVDNSSVRVADVTIIDAQSAILAQVNSRVSLGGLLTLDAGLPPAFIAQANVGSIVFLSDVTGSVVGPFACNPNLDSEIMVNSCTLDLSGVFGIPFGANNGSLITLNDSTITYDGNPCIVQVQSDITVQSSTLSGIGPTVVGAQTSRHTMANSSYESTAATAIIMQLGSIAAIGDGCTITAAIDGVDCTGGGQTNFEADASVGVFTVGGNELVVGPNVLEQSSFALALPNPGDSFANAGGGSFVNRNA